MKRKLSIKESIDVASNVKRQKLQDQDSTKRNNINSRDDDSTRQDKDDKSLSVIVSPSYNSQVRGFLLPLLYADLLSIVLSYMSSIQFEFVLQIGQHGSERDGHLCGPTTLCLSEKDKDEIFVTDFGNKKIQVFHQSNGRFLRQISNWIKGKDFYYLEDILVIGNDIIVTEIDRFKYEGNIYVLDGQTGFMKTWTNLNKDFNVETVIKYRMEKYLDKISNKASEQEIKQALVKWHLTRGAYLKPCGLTFKRRKDKVDLFVSELVTNSIFVFEYPQFTVNNIIRCNELVERTNLAPKKKDKKYIDLLPNDFHTPKRMRFDEDELFVVGNMMYSIGKNYRVRTYYNQTCARQHQITSVAVHGSHVLVCDSRTHRINVIDRQTRRKIKSFGGKGTEQDKFNQPEYLCINPKKNQLFVCDRLNSRVLVFE